VRRAGFKRATGVLLLLLAAAMGTAVAQVPAKLARVGYLSPGAAADPMWQRRFEALRQGLRELAYVEGQTIAFEARWAESRYDRYPALPWPPNWSV
jgi:hypothetical protein